MDNIENSGTCELIIFCYKCKSMFQLNPDMIAIALATDASIWEIYEYILEAKCRICDDPSSIKTDVLAGPPTAWLAPKSRRFKD